MHVNVVLRIQPSTKYHNDSFEQAKMQCSVLSLPKLEPSPGTNSSRKLSGGTNGPGNLASNGKMIFCVTVWKRIIEYAGEVDNDNT